VVLGMHRSGTSALAGVLNQLGFATGKAQMPANEFNARGYFEDERIKERLESLLSQLGRSWHDQRLLPAHWLASTSAQDAAKDLVDLFRDEFEPGQPMVFKDPRACRLLPLLQEVWRSIDWVPRYVFALRSPHAVVRSLALRDGMPAQRAALLYLAYLLEAELHTRGLPRAFAPYDALLTDWRRVIRHIGQGLALDMTELEPAMALQGHAIDSFVSSDLNHFNEATEQPSGLAMNLALEAHALLGGPMNGQAQAALDDLRGRWLLYLQDLEPMLEEVTSLGQFKADVPKLIYSPDAQLLQAIGQQGRSELFYASAGQAFGEDRKLYELWPFGQLTEQRFVFPTLRAPITSLRWDISDRPAYCKVHKVWIQDDHGQVQWTCQSGTDLFGPTSSDMHHLSSAASGGFDVLSSGFDPHVPLNVPAPVLQAIKKGWSFCTSMQVELPMLALAQLGQGFAASRQQLQSAWADLSAAASERDTLQHCAATQSARLQELEQKVARVEVEFKRAEAQLKLFKELWPRTPEYVPPPLISKNEGDDGKS
jgi:hypothetical protein